MKAWAWRSGKIELGRHAPDGAICFASGPAKALHEIVGVLARHAYDGKTLLVPGIPEATSDDEAIEALSAFAKWVEMHLEGKMSPQCS